MLKVPRHGKKIYFYYTQDESDLAFFHGLIFAKTKKEGTPDGSFAQTDGMICRRQWIYVWFPDNEHFPTPDTGSGHWEGVSLVKCKSIKDECVGVVNEFGICEGGTGDDGGYDYPGGGGGEGTEPEEEEDPCEKAKNMITNPVVKAKIDGMKDQSKLPYSDPNYGETGYKFDANGVPTSKITGGKHDVDLGDTAGYLGAYHNHTVLGTNMLSPADIIKLLDFSLAQTNGNIEDGYLGVIGSEVCSSCPGGYKYYHYIINFNGNMSELTQYVYNNTWNLEQLKKDFKKRDGILADNPLYVDNLGDELNSQGLEKLFFDTLKNMGLDGKVSLQRIENDGTVKTVTLNSDGNTTTETPCPN